MANANTQIIKICEVVALDTTSDSNRIKVRLTAEDNTVPVEKLPYAIPLLPLMVHVKPKLHEAVLVFTAIAENGNTQRYYIGPVISQVNHMYEEPMSDALELYVTNDRPLDPKPSNDTSKTYGAIPKDNEIALCGRKSSDLILSDNDLRLRCGAKLVTDIDKGSIAFNSVSPAYIKLKYYENGLDGVDKCNSTATIVADKINLISNKSKDHNFATNDPDEFINDPNMADLITTAHRLPYGDILIKFLEYFRMAFMTHTHPMSMMPPCAAPGPYDWTKNFDLNSALSDSVRIN